MAPAGRSVVITGVGSCVPPRVLTNRDLERMVETSDEWIRSRTGIAERHLVDPGTNTSDLATEAAKRALESAGVEAQDLDLVLCATATPDMLFPATGSMVQDRIGATRAGACDVSAGCSGFAYALVLGSQFVAAGLHRRVLVVGADTLTRFVDWSDRTTCVLFGDGAGAVVLEAGDGEGFGLLAHSLGSDGSRAHLLKMPGGGSRTPPTLESVAQGMHFLQMAGGEVFRFAVKAMEESVRDCLEQAGLQVADIDLFVPHQANFRIIDAAARRLGLPNEKVFVNVDRYGNTSCASIPIALTEAVQQDRLREGSLLVFCGFGAGLSWGGGAIRWSGVRHRPTSAQVPAAAVAETPLVGS